MKDPKMITNIRVSIILLMTSMMFLFNNCGGGGSASSGKSVSNSESNAVKTPAFKVSYKTARTSILSAELNNGNDFGDSVLPKDPFVANLEDVSLAQNDDLSKITDEDELEDYIKEVSEDTGVTPGVGDYVDIKSSYDFEKAVVTKMVKDRLEAIQAGENLPLLIPVEFQFTTGDKHDWLSFMAYTKSILRNDSDGESIIQTKNDNIAYKVSHVKARADFIKGKARYFSVVEVKEKMTSGYDAVYGEYKTKWNLAGLNTWQLFNSHLLSGLPINEDYQTHLDRTKAPAFSSLNLADIRNPIVPAVMDLPFMQPDVSAVGRNNEVIRYLKDTFNLDVIMKNRAKIASAFMADRTVASFPYKGYNGMNQVIERLNSETKSARLTTSVYTPIVLDLGKQHIRTTSEKWGTYFNLANGRTFIGGVEQPAVGENSYTHKTAWIGGYMQKIGNPLGAGYPQMWTRIADDGFLVLPKDGKIETSEQLFGTAFINPDAPTTKYANGFEALQGYAGTKDACAAPYTSMDYRGRLTDEILLKRYDDVKARYIGPWSDVYSTLKIWVDGNMNGVSDSGELKSLQEAGVMAINTCLMADAQTKETDQYGNKTTLRSAFLMDTTLSSANIDITLENKILRSVATGERDDGTVAEFRLVVDIYFRAIPGDFLERSISYRSTKLVQTVEILIGAESISADKFKGVTYVEIR